METDLHVHLEYRSSDRSAIQNWTGAGWYLSASREHEWVVEPARINPELALQIGAFIDHRFGRTRIAHAMVMQNGEAVTRLRERVQRLKSIQAELADAEDQLVQYVSELQVKST